VSIQELTEATTAIAETLPVMIIATSATAAITMMMTDAATTGVMTTGTIIVKDNNTVTNEIAMMAITISVVTSTTMTYVLALNRELGTVRPMKPVVAWSTIWSTVPITPLGVKHALASKALNINITNMFIITCNLSSFKI
jgi:hypothetical protein